MKLLIIDPEGLGGLDLAMRAERDGHQVRYFINETPHTTKIGSGLVTVVRDFKPFLKWADLVFMADNNKYVRDMDLARRDGVRVLGPSQEAAAWELDREVGMKVFRKAGIDVPPYRNFKDYDAAIAYVKREGRAFVSKPSQDQDKSLSYVSKSPAELIYMLQRWKKNDKLKGNEFILQERIEGTEMGVGGWFGPGGWCSVWEENFEFKKLMDGDLGVATGEQGTVMRFVKRSKLADKLLLPLTDQLERINYVGNVDVNCIIDEKGQPWPLEFTMRPGWPAFNIQDALVQGDSVEWLRDLTMGKDSLHTSDEIAMGVVLSIPDYPYSRLTHKDVAGIPIYGIKPSLWEHLHPCHMMLTIAPNDVNGQVIDLPTPATAGDYVLVMTGTGSTVSEAKHRVYARLKRLTVPNSPMWRTDIGDRLRKQLPRIQEHGYARGLLFSTPA